MMTRFRRSIDIAKASWAVLQHDRELLWLPVISALMSLTVVGVVGIPLWLSSDGIDDGGSSTGSDPVLWIAGLIILVAVTLISVFFNAAIASGARERFSGGDPTVSSSVQAAFSRLHVIVPWALLAATVGLIVRSIQNSDNALARFVGHLINAAWGVLTFLVVPILVVEKLGPFRALKRSTELFRTTWGENLSAQVGFGLIGFLAILPAVAIAAIAAAAGSGVVLVLGIAVAVAWVALVVVVLSTLTVIFQMALYLYATTGQVPSGFEQSGLNTTFLEDERRQGPLMRRF